MGRSKSGLSTTQSTPLVFSGSTNSYVLSELGSSVFVVELFIFVIIIR